MRILLRFFAISILMLCVLFATAWYSLQRPLETKEAPIRYQIPKGQSLKGLSNDLAARGLIPFAPLFYWTGRVHGLDKALKAGYYELDAKNYQNQLGLLTLFLEGSVTQQKLTIIEGHTLKQVLGQLSQNSQLSSREQLTREQVAHNLDLPVAKLEGQVMADTYVFAEGQSAMVLIKQAHEQLKRVLSEEWEKRQANLPYQSPYEALIMASIVEKETGRSAERPLIASVFVNRLRLGMRLQTDPTVIYGMGDAFDGNIRKRDLTTDTPYNTYTRAGLPPTPIALPGRESIRAALSPATTDYLYFVARGDGSSEFSSNLSAHNRAVQKYQLGR